MVEFDGGLCGGMRVWPVGAVWEAPSVDQVVGGAEGLDGRDEKVGLPAFTSLAAEAVKVGTGATVPAVAFMMPNREPR